MPTLRPGACNAGLACRPLNEARASFKPAGRAARSRPEIPLFYPDLAAHRSNLPIVMDLSRAQFEAAVRYNAIFCYLIAPMLRRRYVRAAAPVRAGACLRSCSNAQNGFPPASV